MGPEGVRSLNNVFKELEADEELKPRFKRPEHGYLGGWVEQGVLLLNAVLTVREGEANSHAGQGWEQLTDAVIKWISKNCSDVVFMLWGMLAKKKKFHVNMSNSGVIALTKALYLAICSH